MSVMLAAATLALVQPGDGGIDLHGPPRDPIHAWVRCMAQAATPLVMSGSNGRRAVRRAGRDCAPLEAPMSAFIQRSEQAAGRTVDMAEANRMAETVRAELRGPIIQTLDILRQTMPPR
ncbi:MAG TPA: hypothetical protein VF702_02490 [Allosphingosinicella sp.]|jgi:hypothetical protein